MEKLYYSKGVSRSALIGSVISIITGIILGIWLFSEANATEKAFGFSGGKYVGNGSWQYSTPVVDKYDDEVKEIFYLCASVMIVMSVLEAGVLVLKMRSWVEIYQDSIRANTMGKDITCKIADLTSITFNKFAGMLSLEGPAGKIKLFFKEPESAQNIIKNLMYNKVSTPGNSQQTAPQAVYSDGTNGDNSL